MHFFTLFRRRLTGAAVLACAVALIPAAALAATAAAPAAAPTPACSTAGLVVWLENQGVALGTTVFHLNFTNLSGHACTLDGSPGVSAVSLQGQQIGPPASGDYSGHPPAVRLANGATAYAVLGAYGTGYPASRCGPVTAAGLRVYPPNQTASKVVPFPIGACRHVRFMYVDPVQRG